jgi:uncharacterized membrane protein YfcA
MDPVTALLIFLVGVAGSFIGAQVGSGGLLTIPLLIFTGLPPHVALATSRFGSLGGRLTSAATYAKQKKVVWKYILPLMGIGVIASFIGSSLLLSLDEHLLEKCIGIILILPLPFLFIKDIGLTRKKIPRWLTTIRYPIYLLVGIYAALFGAASGTLYIYTLLLCFGLTFTESSATYKLPGFVNALLAVIVFAVAGLLITLQVSFSFSA